MTQTVVYFVNNSAVMLMQLMQCFVLASECPITGTSILIRTVVVFEFLAALEFYVNWIQCVYNCLKNLPGLWQKDNIYRLLSVTAN